MMRMRSPVVAALAMVVAVSGAEAAATTPEILTGKSNRVPACVTPDRLMSFLEARNKALPARFREIAADYKRHGEELHVRWDYAFYQMLVETNYLQFVAGPGRKGDVSPGQNNFAGLGAIGHHAPGESFPDVDTGVLAHLQHIRLYSGEPVDNPVAERTKLVTDLILPWAQSLKHPVTFTDLTHKWAPNGHSYADAIEGTADFYRQAYCHGGDQQQTASADETADNAADAPAKPVVKTPAKFATVSKKKTVTQPAATDEASADTPAAEEADAATLAGPALRKPAKLAVVKIVPPVSDASADANQESQADAAALPAKSKPKAKRAAPVVAAAADDGNSSTVEAVSPAAGQVVAAPRKSTAKLPVAATVTAPVTQTADAASDQSTDAADASTGDEGAEGGATEVKAPVVKAPAAKVTTATAKAVVKTTAKPAVLASVDGATTTETTTEEASSSTQLASLTVPANPVPTKNCKVFTASYGGGKSLLIQSVDGDHTRFTALTVNEAKADAQAKAFINVYARGGQKIAEFGTQNEALTKAFQLCPEG